MNGTSQPMSLFVGFRPLHTSDKGVSNTNNNVYIFKADMMMMMMMMMMMWALLSHGSVPYTFCAFICVLVYVFGEGRQMNKKVTPNLDFF